jgi:hypothetical protein
MRNTAIFLTLRRWLRPDFADQTGSIFVVLNPVVGLSGI